MIDYRLDNKWTVYVHIAPNGKCYVGITSYKTKKRWGRDGVGYKDQMFYRAIQKYGWHNIEHHIIAKKLTKDEAETFEKTLIRLLKSNDDKYGYNVANGGLGINSLGISPSNYVDLTGKSFGNLLIIKRVEDRISKSGNHSLRYLCKCNCGNSRIIDRHSLISYNTSDCGCGRKNRPLMSKRQLNKCYFSGNNCIVRTKNNIYFHIDREDYKKIRNIAWVDNDGRIRGYHINTWLQLHNFILDFKPDKNNFVIHKDGNNFNCRKDNLLVVNVATRKQSLTLHKNKYNKHYGIKKMPNTDLYKIALYRNGKCKSRKNIESIEQAIYVRNELLKEMYKDNEILANVVSLFYCNE